MVKIKEHDILYCINEKDSHFLKPCKVKNIEYDSYYPWVAKLTVKYENETKTYKAIDMEYNFIIINGSILTFD